MRYRRVDYEELNFSWGLVQVFLNSLQNPRIKNLQKSLFYLNFVFTFNFSSSCYFSSTSEAISRPASINGQRYVTCSTHVLLFVFPLLYLDFVWVFSSFFYTLMLIFLLMFHEICFNEVRKLTRGWKIYKVEFFEGFFNDFWGILMRNLVQPPFDVNPENSFKLNLYVTKWRYKPQNKELT